MRCCIFLIVVAVLRSSVAWGQTKTYPAAYYEMQAVRFSDDPNTATKTLNRLAQNHWSYVYSTPNGLMVFRRFRYYSHRELIVGKWQAVNAKDDSHIEFTTDNKIKFHGKPIAIQKLFPSAKILLEANGQEESMRYYINMPRRFILHTDWAKSGIPKDDLADLVNVQDSHDSVEISFDADQLTFTLDKTKAAVRFRRVK